jgi:hypothetical protein
MKAGFDYFREDVIIAHHCFYVLNHCGQDSPEYARLSKIGEYYDPGPRGNDDPDRLDYAQQEIYRGLCARHGVPCDITEDKIQRLRDSGMIEYKLYDHWASSLINGDDSGLDEKDIAAIDSFIESEGLGSCVDVWEDSEFGRPECGGLPGSVSTFVFCASPDIG